jgi:hypothetical protein
LPVYAPRYSGHGALLEPLLEYYAEVINMDPEQFGLFDIMKPPPELPYANWYIAGSG